MKTDFRKPTNHSHWNTLQGCWAELKSVKDRPFGDTGLSPDLQQRHADAMEALVASGEMEAAIAEEVGAAFEQAIAHVKGLRALCYIAFPIEYLPRQDLMEQTAMLEEMASKSDLDPATVAQVQAALERDIAWLVRFQAGKVPGKLDDTEVNATSAEAARVLVQLLLRDEG